MSRSSKPLNSLTLISSPYHVGLRAHPIHGSRVSEGPDYLISSGLISRLQTYGLPIHQLEIPPVANDFEGEIGRTFELIRRVATAVVHCGMRDVNELEKDRVEGSDMGVVWGDAAKKVDFVGGLRRELDERFQGSDGASLVHLDVDAIDASLGKANAFACTGGLFEDDVEGCMVAISERTNEAHFIWNFLGGNLVLFDNV
ncbi:hypothetical protein N0V88_002111 [Collariella sp. IMI 366227]|nr:hypothetical protein N0V88_002111 [Collariella sp. IMI 366227]